MRRAQSGFFAGQRPLLSSIVVDRLCDLSAVPAGQRPTAPFSVIALWVGWVGWVGWIEVLGLPDLSEQKTE